MARNSQAALLIERRRQQVAELYLQCQPQTEIARQMGVSQGTISNDLRAIRRQWRAAAVRDFDQAVAIELAKLDNLEREAWRGWNLTLEPAESTKVTQQGSEKRASPDGDEAYHSHVMSELTRLAEEAKHGPVIVDADYVSREVDRAIADRRSAKSRDDKEPTQEKETA